MGLVPKALDGHQRRRVVDRQPVGLGRLVQAGDAVTLLDLGLLLWGLVSAAAGLGWVLCAFEVNNGGDV